ncbi:MAG: bifunctional aspartate transaminase/aspartate 4-decarboxylase [Desulfovibrio sp.]
MADQKERIVQNEEFAKELAEETQHGGMNRRDFFRVASMLGMTSLAAGSLLGMSGCGGDGADKPAPLPAVDWQGYEQESPFEIKNILIERAKKAAEKNPDLEFINAGRGNPDFLNTTARKAYGLLTLFAAQAAEMNSKIPDLGFRVKKEGLADALNGFVAAYTQSHPGDQAADFLNAAMIYAQTHLHMDKDDVAFQLIDGINGDFYPDPPRIFPVTEAIVTQYLNRVVFSGKPPADTKFNLFATEGATAAMIYVFDSLRENKILNPGDKVAIVTPIFSPYLELPKLKDYGLETVYIKGDEEAGWQIPDSELEKLKDPSVKALYMVNPTNPTSVSLSGDTVKRIANVIRTSNENMVVISDTVYASFVDEFNTMGSELPDNIIGVYSFSKYFGVTGWRLGVVMTSENCVVDKLIKALPEADKKALDTRYSLTSLKPESIPFFERLEMDSRQVALAHTGGLSGPQQVGMCLFSLFELLDGDFVYKKHIQAILKSRWASLYNHVGLPAPDGKNLTRYYALIDLKKMATKMYSEGFAEKLTKGPALKFLFRLAEHQCVVCLPGEGFAGPEWSLRVALANVQDKECAKVGLAIRAVMKHYYEELGD